MTALNTRPPVVSNVSPTADKAMPLTASKDWLVNLPLVVLNYRLSRIVTFVFLSKSRI
jgi:hypothetical protein